jgi:hypothetical protein
VLLRISPESAARRFAPGVSAALYRDQIFSRTTSASRIGLRCSISSTTARWPPYTGAPRSSCCRQTVKDSAALVEAMASGTPVVASDIAVFREVGDPRSICAPGVGLWCDGSVGSANGNNHRTAGGRSTPVSRVPSFQLDAFAACPAGVYGGRGGSRPGTNQVLSAQASNFKVQNSDSTIDLTML